MTSKQISLELTRISRRPYLTTFQRKYVQEVASRMKLSEHAHLSLEELEHEIMYCSSIIIDKFCTKDFLQFSSIDKYLPYVTLGKYNILGENNLPSKTLIEYINLTLKKGDFIPRDNMIVLFSKVEKNKISRILFYSGNLKGNISKINSIFGVEFFSALELLWCISDFFEKKLQKLTINNMEDKLCHY